MEELDIPPGGSRAGLASMSYRAQRRTGMDPGTKRLAIISGGLGGVLVLIVGFYSLSGRHDGPVPVVQADKTPLRVKPDNPGGLQVAGVGDDILAGGADGHVQSIAPAPEKPDPNALRAQAAAPAAPPVAAPSVTPAPAAAPPVVAAIPAAPAKPAARSEQAAVPPAAKPHPAVAPPAPAALHGPQVQLAALSSEQAAREEWDRLTRRMPDLLSRRHPEVARAEVNGRTFWRLRTTGFADATQATSFCEQVRAKGGGCSVATF